MVKEELTKKQTEILEQLTDKNLTIKQIADERGVSQQAVYAQVRIIISKGWLKQEYTPNYEVV